MWVDFCVEPQVLSWTHMDPRSSFVTWHVRSSFPPFTGGFSTLQFNDTLFEIGGKPTTTTFLEFANMEHVGFWRNADSTLWSSFCYAVERGRTKTAR